MAQDRVLAERGFEQDAVRAVRVAVITVGHHIRDPAVARRFPALARQRHALDKQGAVVLGEQHDALTRILAQKGGHCSFRGAAGLRRRVNVEHEDEGLGRRGIRHCDGAELGRLVVDFRQQAFTPSDVDGLLDAGAHDGGVEIAMVLRFDGDEELFLVSVGILHDGQG